MGEGGFSALAKFKGGGVATRTIDWPGKIADGKQPMRVGIRVPTELEQEEARIETWKFLVQDIGMDPDKVKASIQYDREVYTRILAKVLFLPDSGELMAPICSDLADFKRHVTGGERGALIQALTDFMNEVEPDLDEKEGLKEAAKLLLEVKKKGRSKAALMVLLSNTPPSVLRNYVHITAPLLADSLEDKS